MALLEEHVLEAEKSSLLVRARRIEFVSRNDAAPSYLQGRVLPSLPLPRVMLQQIRVPNKAVKKGRDARGEERRKLRNLVAFLIGMEGGPKGEGMPRDIFPVVMDFIMPPWDPLRRGVIAGPFLQG